MHDKSKTASFDVDPQKTFTPLCPSELPVPGGNEIAPALNEQATFAAVRVGSKDAHSPAAAWVATSEHPQFSPETTEPDLDIHWNLHAQPGTEGFNLLDGLPQPAQYDYFVWKGVELNMHPYGACYHTQNWKQNRLSTGVIEVLKCKGIDTVIVGGLALDYCVKTTALQLRDAGFNVVVNLKACRGIADSTVTAAITEMESTGIIVVDDIAKFDWSTLNQEQALGL